MKLLMERWRKAVEDMDKEEEEEEIKKLLPDEHRPLEEDDDEYPSWKERKRLRKLGKTEDGSWVHGYDQLAALANGVVRADETKKPAKKNCHAYQPYHSADDGRFVNPDKEKGSYSMAAPDKDSPDDCTWGKSSRKSANKSRQAVKQPCGRGAKHRCKDGSAKWEEQLIKDGVEEQDAAYIRGIISQELRRALQANLKSRGCSYQEMVRAINLMAAAEKGELYKKDK